LVDGLTPSLTVLLTTVGYCIIATPSPVYLFKHVKHGTQNIQNDSHQWLCDSLLECTKFVFVRSSTPGPTEGAYSAPPNPLAGLRGPISKGEREEGRGKRGKGIGWKGPLTQILDPPWTTTNNNNNNPWVYWGHLPLLFAVEATLCVVPPYFLGWKLKLLQPDVRF